MIAIFSLRLLKYFLNNIIPIHVFHQCSELAFRNIKHYFGEKRYQLISAYINCQSVLNKPRTLRIQRAFICHILNHWKICILSYEICLLFKKRFKSLFIFTLFLFEFFVCSRFILVILILILKWFILIILVSILASLLF